MYTLVYKWLQVGRDESAGHGLIVRHVLPHQNAHIIIHTGIIALVMGTYRKSSKTGKSTSPYQKVVLFDIFKFFYVLAYQENNLSEED